MTDRHRIALVAVALEEVRRRHPLAIGLRHRHHVEAIADPVDSYLFADGEGKIPAWVGLEYMAQAISAYAGIIARQNGEEPSIGFLLGTRRYDTHVDSFTPGQQLRVNVREVFRDENNLVLFDCDIHAGEDLLASAQVKAIQPKGTIQIKPDETVKEL